MKKHKMSMTRPQFMTTFMLDSPSQGCGELTLKDLEKLLDVSYDAIYCVYSVLMKADLSKKELLLVDADDDHTVAIQLRDKDRVKEIKEYIRGDEKIRLGERKYRVEVKAKNDHLFISVILTNPEILNRSITGHESSPEDED